MLLQFVLSGCIQLVNLGKSRLWPVKSSLHMDLPVLHYQGEGLNIPKNQSVDVLVKAESCPSEWVHKLPWRISW